MTKELFDKICNEAVYYVRFYAPIDTGNLRNNAVQFEYIGNDTCKIYVDEDIAPYMPYTNEPWLDPRWNGKKNPNEHWWQDTARDVSDILATELGGRVE